MDLLAAGNPIIDVSPIDLEEFPLARFLGFSSEAYEVHFTPGFNLFRAYYRAVQVFGLPLQGSRRVTLKLKSEICCGHLVDGRFIDKHFELLRGETFMDFEYETFPVKPIPERRLQAFDGRVSIRQFVEEIPYVENGLLMKKSFKTSSWRQASSGEEICSMISTIIVERYEVEPYDFFQLQTPIAQTSFSKNRTFLVEEAWRPLGYGRGRIFLEETPRRRQELDCFSTSTSP